MHITEIGIRNFRNFESAKFKFTKNTVNTLIGENASGKTNLFYAMRLVLDENLPLSARQLTNSDFYRGIGSPNGHWIIIAFKFAGLGSSDEDLVLANHSLLSGHDDLEGTYTFIYRPKKSVRTRLYEITKDNLDPYIRKEKATDYLKSISIDREYYEIAAFTRTTVDMSSNQIYNNFAGNFEESIFPNPEDEDSTLIGNTRPPHFSLIKEISCTYVKALRNVVADMKYANSNPLVKLLSKQSKIIADSHLITTKVKDINTTISELAEIKTLSAKIKNTLLSAVGHTYSPTLEISSNLPEDFEELIKSLGLLVEDSSGYLGSGRLEDLSLGGANLIYLALKLYEYEAQVDSNDKIAHFLLIEEPEAHIHTHVKKTLFSNVSHINTQVFISTHSSQISSVSQISAVNVLARKRSKSEVYQPANGLNTRDLARIERYLDAVRSTLLFAKGVMLVEGEAEQILIPTLIKKVTGISLDELGISLVSMGGTVFKHISDLFHQDRLRTYCAILTDRDEAYLTAPTVFANKKDVDHLIAADRDGLQRKNELDAYITGNSYTRAFYAQNTFETELLNTARMYNHNTDLFRSTLPLIYERQSFITAYEKHFTSADESERNHYVLKLANKVGKGWFALLLSEKSHSCLYIPTYILNALSHVLKGHATEEIWKKMFSYRLQFYKTGNTLENYEKHCTSKGVLTQHGTAETFAEFFTNDPVAILIRGSN